MGRALAGKTWEVADAVTAGELGRRVPMKDGFCPFWLESFFLSVAMLDSPPAGDFVFCNEQPLPHLVSGRAAGLPPWR